MLVRLAKRAAVRSDQIPLAAEFLEVVAIDIAGHEILSEIVERPTVICRLHPAIGALERTNQRWAG